MGNRARLRRRGAGKRTLAALRLFGLASAYAKVRLRSPSRRAPCDRTLSRAPAFTILLGLLLLPGGLSGVGVSYAPGQENEGLVAARRNLMPVPRRVEFFGDPLVIRRDFTVSVSGPPSGVEPRIQRAVVRMLERLARQTGIPVAARIDPDRTRADLRISYSQAVPQQQEAEEDESYELRVEDTGAELRSRTPYGILRGLETFLQLVEVARPRGAVAGAARASAISDLEPEPDDFVVPGVVIADAPRFPWRGLLIDPGRHFLSLDVIKRNLDAMAAVKLNVLHWHLSEDQGFRVESRVFSKLHELGSGGLYYTQDEIRDLIAYADDRGIRVMPEFDMPGHTTSWFVGYPELASAPGPYEIIETWGIQNPVMDPTRDQTYEFLAAFIAEMAALFPDPYFHIGGDEVNGNQWNANPAVQEFIVEQGLGDNQGMQAYFNRRLQPILAEHGKKMVGWDEIMHPDLSPDIVVQSWRGPEMLAQGARLGFHGILSNGYYIDLMYPAAQHYAVDPLGDEAAMLTAEQRARILGGEATMWGEYVADETIDSRIWPRTAAIAERFWSPASVSEVDDMYRRLEATSRWLEWVGVTHRSGYPLMLARLSAGQPIAPLRMLTDVLEPLKGYRRGRTRAYSRFTPLNRLVDAARPESAQARGFGASVDEYLASGGSAADELHRLIEEQLMSWRDNHPAVVTIAAFSTMLPEAESLSAQLRTTAEVGLDALRDIDADAPTGDREHTARLSMLERADTPRGALRLMVVEHVRRLVDAAHASRR